LSIERGIVFGGADASLRRAVSAVLAAVRTCAANGPSGGAKDGASDIDLATIQRQGLPVFRRS